MFAVIKTGGKQYKVSAGDQFAVEKLAAEPGETVQFNDVLMLGGDTVSVGTPIIDGAGVQAEVVEQGRGDKVYNFKKRRRKHSSKRLKGHRQSLTTVKILEILTAGADKSGVKAALGAGSAPKADEAAPAKAAPRAKAVEKKAEAPAAAVEAARPANLLEAAKGDADDLTKISGVGPKLQEKLNENGVYHFWQIAEWGPAELAFMDDQLSFKGRMERDEWIKQATEFAGEAK
ncbi:50S ribosomal protein L21 [Rhodobacteraceae bacterium NNCM2]|nr:50S ribosomal protein L21 [Coraliihabitans acroporae]